MNSHNFPQNTGYQSAKYKNYTFTYHQMTSCIINLQQLFRCLLAFYGCSLIILGRPGLVLFTCFASLVFILVGHLAIRPKENIFFSFLFAILGKKFSLNKWCSLPSVSRPKQYTRSSQVKIARYLQ